MICDCADKFSLFIENIPVVNQFSLQQASIWLRIRIWQQRNWCIYDGANKDLTAWHEHDDCVAIVNIQAGSAGLNDFVSTNVGIFFGPPENYIDFTQAKGRIDRIGQTKQPVYYYLQIAGSVEPQIYKTLELGQNFDLHLFESWLEEGGK